jgi:hypothetical protein
MEATLTRIERKIWNADRGSYIATGQTTDINIESLEATTQRLSVSDGRFLKGPIPWAWIIAAAELPGHALLVGLCIWRLAGATKSYNVSFGNSDLKPLGIDRAAKSRALQALETAGLISVARRRGRCTSQTLYPGMSHMNENTVLNIKNKSHVVTAEFSVSTAKASGAIIVQGGRFGG